MKTTLLSALALVVGMNVAAAQVSGVSISPVGATADDPITITVNTVNTCPDDITNPGQTLNDPAVTGVRMHAGVKLQGAGRFGNVVSASPLSPAGDGQPYSIVGFAQVAPGVWQKTLTIRTYFSLPAGAVVEEFNFVLNGGPDDGNRWEREGKYDSVGCRDYNVPLPITAPFGLTSARSIKKAGAFALQANVPNPFSGSTKISYTLARNERINVRVTNILGETVRVLASGVQSAGLHQLEFNGADDKGNRLAPGFYFYTVESATASETRKMLMIAR